MNGSKHFFCCCWHYFFFFLIFVVCIFLCVPNKMRCTKLLAVSVDRETVPLCGDYWFFIASASFFGWHFKMSRCICDALAFKTVCGKGRGNSRYCTELYIFTAIRLISSDVQIYRCTEHTQSPYLCRSHTLDISHTFIECQAWMMAFNAFFLLCAHKL